MKEPVNFADKVVGYKVHSNDIEYSLGNDGNLNNILWIYPQTANARNVINIEFNWRKEYYIINIARSGDGMNFHTTLPASPFGREDYFISFDNFIWWLETKLPLWEKHFGF